MKDINVKTISDIINGPLTDTPQDYIRSVEKLFVGDYDPGTSGVLSGRYPRYHVLCVVGDALCSLFITAASMRDESQPLNDSIRICVTLYDLREDRYHYCYGPSISENVVKDRIEKLMSIYSSKHVGKILQYRSLLQLTKSLEEWDIKYV